MTITIEPAVRDGLYQVVGKGQISSFLNDLAKAHVIRDEKSLEVAFKEQANDKEREEEAFAWSEHLLTDIKDETW